MRRSKDKRKHLSFHKMHALGNDFMVVDAVTQHVNLEPKKIAQWSNRQTGVGFDQLLVVAPPTISEADFDYQIYNADGTRAQQCGNGTRAVALFARHQQLSRKKKLKWHSPAGLLETNYDNPQSIETVMTEPVLSLADIPFAHERAAETPDSPREFELQAGQDQHFRLTPVSMGNPHAVLFVDDVKTTDVTSIGTLLTRHEAFPEGVNVGFCQIVDRKFLRLRVFERGVGETLACGSGACAALVAARLRGVVDEQVKVSLPGGKLRISWPGAGSAVTMSGAAVLVFKGELQL